MEDLVRRDAGIDAEGHRLSTPALDDQVIEQRMKRALRRLLLDDQRAGP